MFLSCDDYNILDKINITKEEHDVVKTVSSNKGLFIQTSDKGNSVLVLNRHDYISRMDEILSDTSKFRCINIRSGKNVNHMLQTADRLERYPRDSQHGVMYGSAKLHKSLTNNFPKFRSILSTTNITTYG